MEPQLVGYLVNLTPHAIDVVGWGEVPPSGEVARCEEVVTSMPSILGIPVIRKELGDIVGLPDPEPNTCYVVSLVVAQKAGRSDVLAVGETVRDGSGRIVGCKSLAIM
jgi:hypothetical protein